MSLYHALVSITFVAEGMVIASTKQLTVQALIYDKEDRYDVAKMTAVNKLRETCQKVSIHTIEVHYCVPNTYIK